MSEMMAGSQTSRIVPDVQMVWQGDNRCNAGDIPVAAYCRVSTNHEIQQSSLELQMQTYQELIDSHPGWVLAGIYADEGISGTSMKKRVQFNRMIEDAKNGRIKYILAKSISRFSRNTVDMLKTVRELKDIGVGVYFEKERVDTLKVHSEFVLTMFAASAQEEIMTLSTNMKLGFRMRFEAGIPKWSALYGYTHLKEKGKRNDWIIVEEEAKLIRRVYEMYYEGYSLPMICETFEKEKIPVPIGDGKWWPHTLSTFLHNEKYVGDALMQKCYITDPIQKKKVINRDAVVRQFYKKDHHKGIIDRKLYNDVQRIMLMKDPHRGATQYPYYGTLICPLCGSKMVRFTSPSRRKLPAWTCGGNGSDEFRRKRTTCPPYLLYEEKVNEGVWKCLENVDENELKKAARNPEKRTIATELMKVIKARRYKKEMSVEYAFLERFVEKITYTKWHEMLIVWKVGITSKAPIEYEKVSQYPYHKLEVREDGYYSNGERIMYSGRQIYEMIARNQDYCENLHITDVDTISPYVQEPGIPIVLGENSVKGNTPKKRKKDENQEN